LVERFFDTVEEIRVTPVFFGLNSTAIDNFLNISWQGKNYSKRIWGNLFLLATQL